MADDITPADLAAAAERIFAHCTRVVNARRELTEFEDDALAVATAPRLEVPADDATPLTLDWINSVAGEGPVVNRGYSVAVGPLVYEPMAEELGGTVELHPEHDGKILRTRGDVRRVASATGEPVKEST